MVKTRIVTGLLVMSVVAAAAAAQSKITFTPKEGVPTYAVREPVLRIKVWPTQSLFPSETAGNSPSPSGRGLG